MANATQPNPDDGRPTAAEVAQHEQDYRDVLASVAHTARIDFVRQLDETTAYDLLVCALACTSPNPWLFLMSLDQDGLAFLIDREFPRNTFGAEGDRQHRALRLPGPRRPEAECGGKCMDPQPIPGGEFYPARPCDQCRAAGVSSAPIAPAGWH